MDGNLESQYSGDAGRAQTLRRRNDVLAAMEALATASLDPRNTKAVLSRMLADPGLSPNGKGGLDVDASKIVDKSILHALKEVTGIQSLAAPDKIDRETYDALMALKGGPKRDAYLDSIRPRLSEACYNAAVSRLDDVIAHVEALQREGKVVEGNGWLDLAERPLETADIVVRKQNGGTKRLGGVIATNVNLLRCPSYFARDYFDKLFA